MAQKREREKNNQFATTTGKNNKLKIKNMDRTKGEGKNNSIISNDHTTNTNKAAANTMLSLSYFRSNS